MDHNLPTPRFYQSEVVTACLEFIRDKKSKRRAGLIVAPTASGKSLMLAFLAKELNQPILNIVPSKELLEQNYGKLILLGGTATIYSASMGQKVVSELTFATIGSIYAAARLFKDMGVKYVTVDECHAGVPPDPNSQFMKFINELAPEKVIGFTATPFYLKSGMAGAELKFLTRMRPVFFSKVLHVIPIKLMTETGFWAKLNYQEYEFDESGLIINTTGSDFTQESVIQAMKIQGVNNNIYIEAKRRIQEERKILIFMDCVENAIKMAEVLSKFAKTGCVHAKTPKKERDRIISGFRSGKIQVVTNVGVLTTGFDYPELDCIIVGTATNSLALYYQIVGRGTRPHPDKKDCLIIDFGGNIRRFGYMETLEIIDYPGYGWGVFNNDILLTNTPMNGFRKTKQYLDNLAANPPTEMWFGKFKGTNIMNLPMWYVEYLLTDKKYQGDRNPRMSSLIEQLRQLVWYNPNCSAHKILYGKK